MQVSVLVAEIVKAGKHPNAAKLKVCTVSDGTDVHQVRQLILCRPTLLTMSHTA